MSEMENKRQHLFFVATLLVAPSLPPSLHPPPPATTSAPPGEKENVKEAVV